MQRAISRVLALPTTNPSLSTFSSTFKAFVNVFDKLAQKIADASAQGSLSARQTVVVSPSLAVTVFISGLQDIVASLQISLQGFVDTNSPGTTAIENLIEEISAAIQQLLAVDPNTPDLTALDNLANAFSNILQALANKIESFTAQGSFSIRDVSASRFDQVMTSFIKDIKGAMTKLSRNLQTAVASTSTPVNKRQLPTVPISDSPVAGLIPELEAALHELLGFDAQNSPVSSFVDVFTGFENILNQVADKIEYSHAQGSFNVRQFGGALPIGTNPFANLVNELTQTVAEILSLDYNNTSLDAFNNLADSFENILNQIANKIESFTAQGSFSVRQLSSTPNVGALNNLVQEAANLLAEIRHAFAQGVNGGAVDNVPGVEAFNQLAQGLSNIANAIAGKIDSFTAQGSFSIRRRQLGALPIGSNPFANLVEELTQAVAEILSLDFNNTSLDAFNNLADSFENILNQIANKIESFTAQGSFSVRQLPSNTGVQVLNGLVQQLANLIAGLRTAFAQADATNGTVSADSPAVEAFNQFAQSLSNIANALAGKIESFTAQGSFSIRRRQLPGIPAGVPLSPAAISLYIERVSAAVEKFLATGPTSLNPDTLSTLVEDLTRATKDFLLGYTAVPGVPVPLRS